MLVLNPEPLTKKSKIVLAVPSVGEVQGEEPYAKYGVTSLCIPLADCQWSCYVFSKGWPSWFWGAIARGFSVKRVILSTLFWKSTVLNYSPSTEVLVWNSDLDLTWEIVMVIFSDYCLSGILSAAWEHVTHSVILP
jgi:hypothetical protein